MEPPAYVSALTSDEESDDDAERVLASLKEHGKPMKHVGKRVLEVGKTCMDHFNHVLEEEEKEAAAMMQASVDYRATMDGLHDKYAAEIQKREDALATASAEKEQEVSEAQADCLWPNAGMTQRTTVQRHWGHCVYLSIRIGTVHVEGIA